MAKTTKSAGVFYKLCKSALAERKIISVYTDDTDSFSVGRVDCVTTEDLRLASLDRYGEESGYDVIRMSRIRRIDYGTSYENKIECLSEGFNPKEFVVNLHAAGRSMPLIPYTLKQVRDSGIVVGLYNEKDDCFASGLVENVDTTSVTLKVIDEFGSNDGTCTVLLDSICALSCNSHRDRTLSFLNKKQR